ncbi:MAG: prolyl oligopeptidase family serine peptidase [Planctomycetes bacterium]|nr:prolyl oligopeptidase family serine peptidase [Planctomycetota bacterium]
MTRIAIPCARLTVALLTLAALAGAAEPSPLFDLRDIAERPLEARVLERREDAGVVVERIEYLSQQVGDEAVRVEGVFAHPVGASRVPGIFWSQGGMAPAGDGFPLIFARKGYACLCVTVRTDRWNGFAPFDAARPHEANLVRLAIDQMRGISYLAQRPEVDPDRIGVAGASYGGFFANVLAVHDPRIKAGMSFFAGSMQTLGSNLPQVLAMPAEGLAAWNGLFEPGTRWPHRDVPFLWAAASNDHWFHLPAVLATYTAAPSPHKRLALIPQWDHGFPPTVDQQLIDWFDVHLAGTRAAYNAPSALEIRSAGGHRNAHWSWKGGNHVARADLVVSYGAVLPWLGWPLRHHEILPATIGDGVAEALLPIPEHGLDLLVYGNLTDERGVVTTTPPLVILAAELVDAALTPLMVNAFPDGDFSAEHTQRLRGTAVLSGVPDDRVFHGEVSGSIRLPPPALGRPGEITYLLAHVPLRAHRLRMQLRADGPAAVEIAVQALAPDHWGTPLVDRLRREQAAIHGHAELAMAPSPTPPPRFTITAVASTGWTLVELDCDPQGLPYGGYQLTVGCAEPVPVWVDSVEFIPQWRR